MNKYPRMELREDAEKKRHSVKLEILSGPADGLSFEMKKPQMVIGRDRDADISLPDLLVSRQHARITQDRGEYWIEDLGSRNGTLVGGARVLEKTRLPLQTIFRVGVSEMRLNRTE
jgi:pSer/pThr/pTyr-binding forkhead associated (FHA) protein